MSETELTRKLATLERDNRRLKAFSFGVAVIIAALGGIYARRPLPQKIGAHEFDVVGSSGRTRATFGMLLHFGGVNLCV